MRIAEHRIESQFLVQAEKLHGLAELAWVEGRTMDMIRYSEDARELMERYYAALEAPELVQKPEPFQIQTSRSSDDLSNSDRLLICILIFITAFGLISFLLHR